MSAVYQPLQRPAHTGQRGFTLVEIMVALTIGVFLTGALLTIVQSNRRVFGEQNQLAQLQDNERMAMTMMADVIQSAGYFPDPHTNSLGTALPLSGVFAAGQSIYGTTAGPPGDTIQVRYMTAGGDGILNCSGLPNPNPVGGPNIVYVNAFSVLNGQLVCTVTMNGVAPTQYTLVGGIPGSGLDITNMSILYGVKANAAATGNNVDTYMNAAQVNALALWSNVISVSVSLTFTNPLSATVGQPATVTMQRLIGVMSQTGPTL
jgi:type IV pilus assembly protein PilW